MSATTYDDDDMVVCAVCGAPMDFKRYVDVAYCGKACRTVWRQWERADRAERAKARPTTHYPGGIESDVPLEQENPDGLW